MNVPTRRILRSQLMVTCHLCPLTHILKLSPHPNARGFWDIMLALLHLGKLRPRVRRLTRAQLAIPCSLRLVKLPPDPKPFPRLCLPLKHPWGKLCLLFASCTKFIFSGNFYLVFQLCFTPLSPGCPRSSGPGYLL